MTDTAPAGGITYDDAFDASYRGYILGVLFNDEQLLAAHRPVIKPAYFKGPLERLVVRVILEYWDQYSALPPYDTWTQYCIDWMLANENDYPEVAALGGSQSAVARLTHLAAVLEGQREKAKLNKYVEDTLVGFAKENEAIIAFNRLVQKQRNGSMDPKDAVEQFEAVAALGMDHTAVGEEFWETCDNLDDQLIDMIPTGIRGLDVALGGGVGRGEMFGFVAPPKGFKTGSLINVAKAASMKGYTVAYVSGEEDLARLKAKMRASITGIVPEDQRGAPEKTKEAMLKARKHFKGPIHMKRFMSQTFSARSIEEWIRTLKIEPDMIIIDFLDLMTPINATKGMQDHLMRDTISVEARDLAIKFNAAVVTANKSNREGDNSVVFGAEGIGLSFGKGFVFDNMVAIGMTDQMRNAGELALFTIYNRYGESRKVIGCKVDLASTQLTYSPEITERMKDEAVETAKDEKKKAKKKGKAPPDELPDVVPTFMTGDAMEIMKEMNMAPATPKLKTKRRKRVTI